MRLFTAICFDEETKKALFSAAKAAENFSSGNFTREGNLHLTLVFIGETERENEIKSALSEVEFPSFEIKTEGIGLFEKGILYIGTEKKEKDEASDAKEKPQKETSEEGIISKIKGMIERIKEVWPKIKKILTDEKNKEAVTHLKNEIIYLIKVLLPKKSKIDAAFSTGSPDTTGQAFGILACFPAMYQKNWRLLPDFESDELYLKGTISGKGRVYGYEIIGIILRIVFDKNCRRLYTMINRFLKWLKKSDKVEDNING